MSLADPHCIFCRIVAGAAPATTIYVDADVLAIRDLHPQAPVHILILPRQHIPSIAAAEAENGALLAKLVTAANQIARELQIDGRGYRLVVNTGPEAGQTVQHLHVHLLGGRQMGWPPG